MNRCCHFSKLTEILWILVYSDTYFGEDCPECGCMSFFKPILSVDGARTIGRPAKAAHTNINTYYITITYGRF